MTAAHLDEHGRPVVRFDATLTEDQAYALAELCKRLSSRDAATLSANEHECRAMLTACDRLRDALAHVGVRVR